MAEYLRQLGPRTVVGFEATGNYHRPLAHFLQHQGCELRLIPTVALARTREAMHNSWDKNDPKDARVILHVLKTGLTQTWHDPLVNGTNDAQELRRPITRLHWRGPSSGTACAIIISSSTSLRSNPSSAPTVATG
jgi:transposase